MTETTGQEVAEEEAAVDGVLNPHLLGDGEALATLELAAAHSIGEQA